MIQIQSHQNKISILVSGIVILELKVIISFELALILASVIRCVVLSVSRVLSSTRLPSISK